MTGICSLRYTWCMITALAYIFALLAIVSIVAGHYGAALLALLWVGFCIWGKRKLDKVPLVIGDGVLEREKIKVCQEERQQKRN